MKRILFTAGLSLAAVSAGMAGNPDRSGQAGAYELLINPWARSSGLNSLNTASVRGLEATALNVAGLSFTEKTEIIFSKTIWMEGTGIDINTFGFAQRLGEEGAGGVLGFNVMAMSFGEIEITTVDQPEGGLGTYSPQFINVGLAYGREFSKSIHGGVLIRGINESISNVSASGIALDAGIQYFTGPKSDPERIKFGISLRNIGTPLRFSGDGLAVKRTSPQGNFEATVTQRSERFELPSLLHIGLAYDLHIDSANVNKLIVVGNFTSNAFYTDQMGLGVEYSFKEKMMLRVGYKYEKNLLSAEDRTSAQTGLAGGFSWIQTLKSAHEKKGKEKGSHDTTLSIDYSYRSSNPFNGTHSIGVRFYL